MKTLWLLSCSLPLGKTSCHFPRHPVNPLERSVAGGSKASCLEVLHWLFPLPAYPSLGYLQGLLPHFPQASVQISPRQGGVPLTTSHRMPHTAPSPLVLYFSPWYLSPCDSLWIYVFGNCHPSPTNMYVASVTSGTSSVALSLGL